MRRLPITCEVVVVAALALSAGCGGPRQVRSSGGPLHLNGVSRKDALWAAERTLSDMHFVIEKLDVQQGIVRTEPLRGAQVFELWRSDNVGLYDTAEANLNTIRRSVELRFSDEQGSMRVDCNVPVQQLSLPENEVASVSQAYQMHSASTNTIQRLQLSPQQKQGMAWIDLGQDQALAARILKRIEARLQHGD